MIIEAKTCKPKAVKLLDHSGAESVHVFKDVVVNEKRSFFDKDPFRPSLRGFKLVLLNDRSAAPAVGEKPIPPPATSKQSKAATGKSRATANDNSELDLGRTADAAVDNPVKKKPTLLNRQ